jgi:hypothetical protein
VFGPLALSAITVESVDRYARAKQREGKLSNNSINKTLNTLSMILDAALDYERIPRNPAKGKKRRLRGEARSRPVVYPEQLLSLLDACAGPYARWLPRSREAASESAGPSLSPGPT